MVSCSGLSHGNERTLVYLRIGAGERPLAVQIFGSVFFFFNETAPTEIYTTYDTLSLHDALPICRNRVPPIGLRSEVYQLSAFTVNGERDRKSTRLNSSHRRLSRMPSSA